MKPVTLTLDPQANEPQVFAQILDAAVRQLGVQGAQAVAHFQAKLDAAVAEAQRPDPEPETEQRTAPKE